MLNHLWLLALLGACVAEPVLRVTIEEGTPVDFPLTSLSEDLFSAVLPPSPIELRVVADACTAELPSSQPFVLFARNGSCSVADKKRTAVAAGASALVVADLLSTHYVNATSALEMTLDDTCLVDCGRGRGMVDASAIGVSSAFAGLPGSCPASVGYGGRLCATSMCAFSGPPSAGSEREVCCVLEQRPSATVDHTPADVVRDSAGVLRTTDVPTATLSLALAHVLLDLCSPTVTDNTAVTANDKLHRPCAVELVDVAASAGRWDGSALLMWAMATYAHRTSQPSPPFGASQPSPPFGTSQPSPPSPASLNDQQSSSRANRCTAALAAYLAAGVQAEEDEGMETAMAGGGGDLPLGESATLDATSAVTFLVMASVGLIGLYFVITLLHVKSAVLLLISLGFIAASSSGAPSPQFDPDRPRSTQITPDHPISPKISPGL